jgi:selenide,water dikinase
VDVELFAGRVPLFNQTMSMAAAGVIPGGSRNNLDHFSKHITWDPVLSALQRIILCDAQTSGGLLFTVPQNEKEAILAELHEAGIHSAVHVGNCLGIGEGMIFVRK